ncbi:MFS transporter [Veillonella atypica]|uniref:Transporter, major facilitator family protein n=1 Tax=Veillonella atypica KON TaxID=1128111 RepID=A0ABP2SQD3_9FIRM|nr:MFS transporter [Veillonella atypica]EKY18042.1 transporter, major facilitator family protein [Veillonella atypica KON]PQL18598.1 MFS transporter [Veillonella atypica KON]SUP07244.1 H+ Antiporter protein [Veillonella atypica]
MNLENKNSGLLNSALFFSTMGSTATTLGFITYIFNTTHSPFDTGAVTIATLLVGMLLGPFLGILVKEKGLMWSMVVPEIVSGFILLIFVFIDNLYLVYIIAFLIGFNNKILGIARLSFVPNITNDLVKFNALLRSINRFALISGSLLFSVIINYSLTMVFVIDAITYIVSAYLLYRLNRNVRIQSHSTISKKTIRESIYDRIQLLLKGYKLLFLNKKINFIVYLGILARIFYMCIPILLLIFIKDILHLTDSQYGYTQTISRLASFIIFGILAKYFTINLATSFKKILFPLFILYGGSIFCIAYIDTIEQLYILYSISEILLFTAVVLVHAYIQSIFSQEELTLASGSVSTGFSIGSILSITIFTNLANILPLHDIFFICGLGIIISTAIIIGYTRLNQER